MWTDETIEMYSSMLNETEQLVIRAFGMGYNGEDILDFISLNNNQFDIDYARAVVESLEYPDKRVPLEA